MIKNSSMTGMATATLRKPRARSRSGGPADQPNKPNRVSSIERRLIRHLLAVAGNPPIAIMLWTGEEFCSSPDHPRARVVIYNRRTLWKLCLNPMFEFGNAYSSGRLDVEGDLAETMILTFQSFDESKIPLRGLLRRIHLPKRNTLRESRDNVHHHYDIGNDFYRLWLDNQMVYTCAYFSDPAMSLEQAQTAKLDHVCRKLRLRPGERVLEAGFGWGALALHMARNYGVSVRAFNISREQVEYARARARREGLSSRVEFVEDDWRNMRGLFDAFVSVGMLEHVGLRNYRQFGEVANRCLKPAGRGLIHTIGQNFPRPVNSWIDRRIFPGAYPPSLWEMVELFEPNHFSVLDVENLRLHYAMTLRHWLDRFEKSADTVAGMFDAQFVRLWRFYLAGSIASFQTGCYQLFQVLFAKAENNAVPRTRKHIYSEGGQQDVTVDQRERLNSKPDGSQQSEPPIMPRGPL